LPGRCAEKSADNLLLEIENAREIELAQFLISLSIDQVGEETAYDLASHFGTLDKIQKASIKDFEIIPGVGGVVAHSIFGWFEDKNNQELLKRLQKYVKIQGQTLDLDGKSKGLPLDGKTFVLTGTMQSMSRDDAKAKIRALGGNTSSSVSKKTDYVVTGKDPGSKYNDAQKLGVKIINENEFMKLTG